MAALDADPRFNAEISWAAQDTRMDGDGHPDSSHMGAGDALAVGERLAEELVDTVAALAGQAEPGGGGGTTPPATGGGGTTMPPGRGMAPGWRASTTASARWTAAGVTSTSRRRAR
jgi:hypothetical protein